jgi:hypothetical protein
VIFPTSDGADAGVVTQTQRPVLELVCLCGITFEPLPWFNAELDKRVCDECADGQ